MGENPCALDQAKASLIKHNVNSHMSYFKS